MQQALLANAAAPAAAQSRFSCDRRCPRLLVAPARRHSAQPRLAGRRMAQPARRLVEAPLSRSLGQLRSHACAAARAQPARHADAPNRQTRSPCRLLIRAGGAPGRPTANTTTWPCPPWAAPAPALAAMYHWSPSPLTRAGCSPRTRARSAASCSPATSFQPATILNLLAAAWLQFQLHDWLSHGPNDGKTLHRGAAGRRRSLVSAPHAHTPHGRRPFTFAGGGRPPSHLCQHRQPMVGRLAAVRQQPARARQLRTFEGGRLRLTATGLLPLGPDGQHRADRRYRQLVAWPQPDAHPLCA